jgi:hypothetical protein
MNTTLTLAQAQQIMKKQMMENPELVIEKLMKINEYKASSTLAALDKVGSRDAGAAQLVMKAVLGSSSKDESIKNLIAFAESFQN